MIPVEICINASDAAAVEGAVSAAYDGGAATIELCADMHLDGLTPSVDCLVAARWAFRKRPGLMAMIRPRAGDFCYSPAELALMLDQIELAAAAGADGVVFGVLQAADYRIDLAASQRLLASARRHGLKTTMHRAFDATPDADATLDALLDLGVDRVLTSGVAWGQRGSALDGVERLAHTIQRARGRIEVVLGGGISPPNMGPLLARLPVDASRISVHAYSGAQIDGQTTIEAVRDLVAAVQHAAPGAITDVRETSSSSPGWSSQVAAQVAQPDAQPMHGDDRE